MSNEIIQRLASLSQKNRKKRRVLFFGREEFSDNTKYLFLHALAQEKDFEVIWCSTQPELINKLRQHDLPCHLINNETSLECINLFLSAAVAVFSVNPSQSLNGDEALFASLQGARHIQLWHGVSVKHLLLKLMPHMDVLSYDFRRPLDFASRADCVLSTSSKLDDFFNESFAARRIIRAGYPRNEVLVREPNKHEMIGSELPEALLQALKNKRRKKILFAPTWQRGHSDLITSSPDFLMKLIQAGDRLNADIFIKSHPIYVEAGATRALSRQAFYINPCTDLYPWMSHFDLLVTDYSSIMFDFLLTGNPVMKLKIELNDHRSFEPDYSLIPPLDFAYDFTEETFASAMRQALLNDTMRPERQAMCDELFETDADKACASLFNLLSHEVDACVAGGQRFTVEQY